MTDHVTVYDQSGRMLAVLDNADEISFTLKHNDLWTGSFTLPASDPKCACCQAHNLVRLPDGQRDTGLFRIISMPSGEETAQGGTRTYNVEHVMATLLDDVLFGYHEVGGTGVTTRQAMQYILDRQTVQRWQLGAVEFTDYFQYHFENVSLLSALLSLGEVLTSDYTWEFDTSTTPWTVSLRQADAAAGCGIYYGRNLVSIEKSMDASALVTRLYPLGYGEGVNQLTIKDVNGGLPYIDADTAGTWGVKCSVWTDTRIEDAETLMARGVQVLEGYKNPYIAYKAKAADLYRLTGYAWDNFMPGKKVDVQDGEHGVRFQARIIEISKRSTQGDPGDIEITIANAPRDAADSINTLADRVGIHELYSQGATNLYAIPFADNADRSHPAVMRIYVPGSLVRINKMLLSWRLGAFRAYETGAASGGGTTKTSASGGGTTQTSASGGAFSQNTSDVGTGGEYTSGLDQALPGSDRHVHIVTLPRHKHWFSIDSHTHDFTIPDHTHSFTIPDHTHGIVYGIYEGATASSVSITVDGTAVPSGAITGQEIDVVPYLSKDGEGKITRGSWHEIRIIPNRLTRIEANLFAQVFIQSVGGGDY